MSRDDTRRVPIRDRRGLLGRRESVELVGVTLERRDHFTRLLPEGSPGGFALLMSPMRLAALAVLWATSAPWRFTVAGLAVLALALLGR